MTKHQRAITELFETVSLGAPEKAVGFVLWRVVHRWMREVDRALLALDLTHLQFTTLAMVAWMGQAGEAATQSELARFADVHPMQLSHMLKALESKGMVVRMRNTSDIRAKHIEITGAGLKVLRKALPIVIDVQRRLFGEEGREGGSLLTSLLRLDGEHNS